MVVVEGAVTVCCDVANSMLLTGVTESLPHCRVGYVLSLHFQIKQWILEQVPLVRGHSEAHAYCLSIAQRLSVSLAGRSEAESLSLAWLLKQQGGTRRVRSLPGMSPLHWVYTSGILGSGFMTQTRDRPQRGQMAAGPKSQPTWRGQGALLHGPEHLSFW